MRLQSRAWSLLFVVVFNLCGEKNLTTNAFAPPATTTTLMNKHPRHARPLSIAAPPKSHSTFSLRATALAAPLLVKAKALALPAAAVSMFAVVMTAFLFPFSKVGKIFYPNLTIDPAFAQHPLPPGILGCPFIGNGLQAMMGSRKFGIGSFYLQASRKLQGSAKKLWMYYFFGRPVIVLAGLQALQNMLNSEFEADGVATISTYSKEKLKKAKSTREKKPRMMGPESMLAEGNKERHSQLRRLVGQALTPAAVAKSIPSLQKAAMEQARKLQQKQQQSTKGNDTVVAMEDYCTEFTLDVAWRQILGLRLAEEEIPSFRQTVLDWITGVTTPQANTGRGIQYTKGYQARLVLEAKIRERIRILEANGPDSSTLSGMVFAQDEEGGKKLSPDEVVDNAMLLILAGSETAASTMANAVLFLGIHRNAWEKVVQEQKNLEKKYGADFTKETLDGINSPYLDAVIKETIRLRPVPTGIPRLTLSTTVIDGKQIPKGWIFDWSVLLTHQLDPVTYQEDDSHMDIEKGFKPERWFDEETTPVEYLPLGAGPRYCLGASLAMTEMKIFLATLARNMDFELAGATAKKNLKWKRLSLVPKEKYGVLVKVVQSTRVPTVAELA